MTHHPTDPRDRQTPGSRKVENDHNKLGDTLPTQKNQGARTPRSRGDRDSLLGGDNQSLRRRGEPGSGKR